MNKEQLENEMKAYKKEMEKYNDLSTRAGIQMYEKYDQIREYDNKKCNDNYNKLKKTLNDLFGGKDTSFEQTDNEYCIIFSDQSGHPFSRVELSKTSAINTVFCILINLNSPISSHIRLQAEIYETDKLIKEISSLTAQITGIIRRIA